jgi:hypothetical protein
MEEDTEDEPEMGYEKPEYEQRYVPEHPYCTNWPVSKEKENEKI